MRYMRPSFANYRLHSLVLRRQTIDFILPSWIAIRDQDEMAINAINDGADRIILLPIFITISSHTQAGQEMLAALEPEKYGVLVQHGRATMEFSIIKRTLQLKKPGLPWEIRIKIKSVSCWSGMGNQKPGTEYTQPRPNRRISIGMASNRL